jgi:hypothetical protein
MKNFRFNRIEKKGRHKYLDDFGGIRNFGDVEFDGLIKCKLVHHEKYSVVLPDQIYFNAGSNLYWLQPLYFSGNQVSWFGDIGFCDFYIDISYGECLRVRFKSTDAISWLLDGSILYKCIIRGPKLLYRYRTGEAKIEGGILYIKLFHHTSRDSKKVIEEGTEYWSSNWNIQGTKKSKNISYLYLTSLPKISNIDDLTQIAMSSQGRLPFRLDGNFTPVPDLILDVYRESTSNRTHTLSHWVDTSFLSPQPCYRHHPPNGPGYHEIVSPFIQRIGVEFESTISINNERLLPLNRKSLGFAVVGDATTTDGLAAPFDEENTEEKLKIEYMSKPDEIIKFWVENANTNQVDNKIIEEVKFG